MKKTLIALAVAALVSSAANATVVYQKDGTKIDIDGRAHFELQNLKDQRTDLRDVGSRLRVRAYQELADDISAYGGVELRFSNNNGNADAIGANFRTHRLYGGFIHKKIGTLTFGSQLHLGDHIPKANYTYEWGGNVFFDGHKKAATFMSVPFGGVRVAADYYFGNSNKKDGTSSGKGSVKDANGNAVGTAWNEGQGYGLGLFYDGKFGDDVAIRFGSGFTEVTQSNTGLKVDEYKLQRAGVGFDVTYKAVHLGFDWAYGKATKGRESAHIGFQSIANAGGPFHKNNRFLVGLKYDVTAQNAVYGQYYFGTAKKADSAAANVKMNGWMIGADHKFNKFVAVYVEGGSGKVKQGGKELLKNHKVLTGVRVLF
ncbi:porin [Lonepinella sp. BR2357]|uniref:porin n=1 Tax=Lonepinella sp. BR2357 TaxID=3434549 RepID=UPI003F6E110F